MANLDEGRAAEGAREPQATESAVRVRMPGADAAALFQGLSQLIYACDDYNEVYTALCHAATKLVTGCDHASLMLADGPQYTTAAASDEIAAQIDGFEREIGDGPCVDAIQDEAAFVEPSLTEDPRWPKLAARIIAHTPVRAVAGFRLLVDEEKVGALNLFSDTPGGLTERSVDEGAVVTSFASVALLAAHRKHAASSLRNGLQSNREIGKAIGLMMAFHKVDDQAAFGMLRKASQDMNVKLAEIAREFVEYHNSPGQ